LTLLYLSIPNPAATKAKAFLITNYSWVINDNGIDFTSTFINIGTHCTSSNTNTIIVLNKGSSVGLSTIEIIIIACSCGGFWININYIWFNL
jgi:hypothetical protein